MKDINKRIRTMYKLINTQITYRQSNIPKSRDVSLRFLVNTGLVVSIQSFGNGMSLLTDVA